MTTNLIKHIEPYCDDEKCRSYLEALKWPDGPKCPRCLSKKISRRLHSHQLACNSCNVSFSVTAGSIMHDSHLPLWKWFLAVYLMCESKIGLSSLQLMRSLGVSYKTAWYLSHRIRQAMATVRPALSPDIEIDDIYVSWAKRYVERGNLVQKSIATDARKRCGEFQLPLHRSKTATKQRMSIDVDAELLGRFKRAIAGSHHQISTKHIDAYLGEFQWRSRNLANPYRFRDTIIRLLNTSRLEYKELVEAKDLRCGSRLVL